MTSTEYKEIVGEDYIV
ncbi:hypothetical protein M1087_16055 [Clostridioides difficile]|nr:hypothetical protein [Clostridioides difficile]